MSNKVYDKTTFKRFFEKDDPRVEAWAENVLSKMCSPGILPVFLNKEDDDYKSFWGTFTHLFAMVVIYARQYNEIDTNKILFDLFVKERGLVTDTVDTEFQMKFLFNNYVNEYRKRGRVDIVSKEGVILGELLRLLRYKSIDEFIFALLLPRDTGWTLGYSSPTWNRTDTVMNMNKGYESTIDVQDLSKYPLINPTGVILQGDLTNEGLPIQTMTFVGNEITGISSEIDKDNLIIIDEDLPYQISMKIKNTGSLANAININPNLTFGVQIYDHLLRPLTCVETVGTIESNSFVKNDADVSFVSNDLFYEFRGTISKKNRNFAEQVQLNFLNGRGLRLVEGAKYLSLVLTQDRTKPCSNINVYDIKIKPLYLPFTQGYLGDKNVIASYYRNNSYQSNTTINKFTKKYLLAHKNIFASEGIAAIQERPILFKVFSERREYIVGAEIEIRGETLITDINGEASIKLYPGDYSYNVIKEKFNTIDRAILNVDEGTSEDVQIEFVLMIGELYKRKVTFVIKDNILNRPVDNVLVNFNGEAQVTDTAGTVFFMVFPGLYTYTARKDRYYPVDRSVLVMDDMIENVTINFIPIFNVTFIVKHKDELIQGALVTFRGQQINTDINGVALFTDIPAGTYLYNIEKTNWLPVSHQLTVSTEDKVENVIFNPVPTYTITFKTFSKVYNGIRKVLPNASVTFAGVLKTSDATGTVTFVVRGGSYDFVVAKDNHKTERGNVPVYQDETVEVVLLENVYKVTFTVKDNFNFPIKGASVVLGGGERGDTNDQGQVVFELPNAPGYSYTVSKNETTPKTGSFVVNGIDQNINIVLETILYQVTFTVTEDGLTSRDASVKLGDYAAVLTNSAGQAIFRVPRGTYLWNCSKRYYTTKNGSIDVNSQATSQSVALVRAESDIKFIVRDGETNQLISGASVICNGIQRSTLSDGTASYRLPIKAYDYTVSKEPDFPSTSGRTNETSDAQTITVYLSSKLYSITMYVVDSKLRQPVIGASVLIGSERKTTNGNGQVTFTDKRNGSYNYSISKSYWSSRSGTVSISNRDTSETFDLSVETSNFTMNVKKDGATSSATMRWSIAYHPNDVAGSNLVYASGSGNVATGPSNGQLNFTDISIPGCISKSYSQYMNGSGSATINLYSALILRHTSQSTRVTATASRMVWSGYDLMIEPSNEGATLSFNANQTTNLTAIVQWPAYFSLSSSSAFRYCTGLSSVAGGSPRIVSNIDSWFQYCSSLSSINSGLFINVSGSDASYCFSESGLRDLPSGTFGSNLTIFFNVCRDCRSLTSISGTPFAAGTNFESAFRQAPLSSISSTIFSRCNVTTAPWCFALCGMSSVPSGLCSSGFSRCTNFEGFFEKCRNLNSLPSNFFRNTGGQRFDNVCIDCDSLNSVGTTPFPNSTLRLYGAFKNCISLVNIINCRAGGSRVTTYNSCWENTAVREVPIDLLEGHGYVTDMAFSFRNCKYLTKIIRNAGEFGPTNFLNNNPISTISGMFIGCTSFVGMGYQSCFWTGNWYKTCTNASNLFNGCTNLLEVVVVGVTSPISYLWLMMPNANGSGAFKGCTKMLAYNIVPSNWR